MSIDITVKRKFNINGKEYNSIEEMPDDIREKFKKTMGLWTDAGCTTETTATREKIIVNGVKYDSKDAMPEDVRQLYETMMRSGKPTTISSTMDLIKLSIGTPGEPGNHETAHPGGMPPPAKSEFSFSVRMLLVGIALGALFFLLYNFWNGR